MAVMQGLRFGFFVFGAFWAAAKCAKHFASSPSQKFSKKFFLFYIGGEKVIKGVFARFRPPQPPVVIHRRKSGGWEAESFMVARGGWLYPTHPKQSLCSDFSPSGFRYLRPKPAFPQKEGETLYPIFINTSVLFAKVQNSPQRQKTFRL